MPENKLPADALERAQAAQQPWTEKFRQVDIPPATDSAMIFQTEAAAE